jgi:hypothetical protein
MPIEIVRELSERAIATARIETSVGVLMVMAKVFWRGGAWFCVDCICIGKM